MLSHNSFFAALIVLVISPALGLGNDLETPKVEFGSLEVRIVGLRNDKGTVHLALFNTKEGFAKRGKEFRKMTVKPASKTAIAEFTELPFGEYAVAMYHDENDDNRHNKGLIFIMMEKYGFSNDAKPGMKGPPEFEKAKFFVLKEQKTITIRAQ